MLHPLTGSNLKTLTRLSTANGPISPNSWLTLAGAFASAAARSPFSLAEKALTSHRLKHAAPLKPPVFILGHWRSGTTHLYNVMSKGDFAYVPPLATGLPWDMFILMKVLRPVLESLLPSGRKIDNVPVEPNSPQEDEIALANMTPVSYYHGLYFPRHFEEHFYKGVFFDGCTDEEVEEWKWSFEYYLRKLSVLFEGKQLLIKNPVYTARVKMIRDIFPEAKFIHIYRNPYDVFPSMRKFYTQLFDTLALQPYDHVKIDEVIFNTYTRMMRAVQDDTAALPGGSFVELSYEQLTADPIPAIEHIYDALGLEGFSEAKPAYESYLKTVRRYKKNKFNYTDEMARLVREHWSQFLRQWNYSPPNM